MQPNVTLSALIPEGGGPRDFCRSSRRAPRFLHWEQQFPLSNESTPPRMSDFPDWHGTTIVSVRKDGRVTVAGDGQVTMGQTVMKANAKKVRRLGERRRCHRRLRRRDRRRLHPVRAARGQARALSRPADPRRGRAGQGLADRPLPAPAGGDDDRRRQGRDADPDRDRRRPRADRRRRRDRLGRQLCARRRARAGVGCRATSTRKASPAARWQVAADICVYTNTNLTVETIG